ncbi:hypothetical protein HPP92_027319 [Vanilla planifolia]|uniref:Uncharacterized protein n=1 Tax=Vanilla planifolia TaxID=51239 RepID=A0A835U684_VANPL|nr:hypothetical protein HPP92_027319 [Vanilla planifolia]
MLSILLVLDKVQPFKLLSSGLEGATPTNPGSSSSLFYTGARITCCQGPALQTAPQGHDWVTQNLHSATPSIPDSPAAVGKNAELATTALTAVVGSIEYQQEGNSVQQHAIFQKEILEPLPRI